MTFERNYLFESLCFAQSRNYHLISIITSYYDPCQQPPTSRPSSAASNGLSAVTSDVRRVLAAVPCACDPSNGLSARQTPLPHPNGVLPRNPRFDSSASSVASTSASGSQMGSLSTLTTSVGSYENYDYPRDLGTNGQELPIHQQRDTVNISQQVRVFCVGGLKVPV